MSKAKMKEIIGGRGHFFTYRGKYFLEISSSTHSPVISLTRHESHRHLSRPILGIGGWDPYDQLKPVIIHLPRGRDITTWTHLLARKMREIGEWANNIAYYTISLFDLISHIRTVFLSFYWWRNWDLRIICVIL